MQCEIELTKFSNLVKNICNTVDLKSPILKNSNIAFVVKNYSLYCMSYHNLAYTVLKENIVTDKIDKIVEGKTFVLASNLLLINAKLKKLKVKNITLFNDGKNLIIKQKKLGETTVNLYYQELRFLNSFQISSLVNLNNVEINKAIFDLIYKTSSRIKPKGDRVNSELNNISFTLEKDKVHVYHKFNSGINYYAYYNFNFCLLDLENSLHYNLEPNHSDYLKLINAPVVCISFNNKTLQFQTSNEHITLFSSSKNKTNNLFDWCDENKSVINNLIETEINKDEFFNSLYWHCESQVYKNITLNFKNTHLEVFSSQKKKSSIVDYKNIFESEEFSFSLSNQIVEELSLLCKEAKDILLCVKELQIETQQIKLLILSFNCEKIMLFERVIL